MRNVPLCCASIVGSFPHLTPESLCRSILTQLPQIPAWPQLPNRSHFENMYIQFSSRLPGIVINEAKQRIYFDTSQDLLPALEVFYTHFLESDLEYFALTPEYAAGFHAFLEVAGGMELNGIRYVKGHITGPISFGLTITDENKRAILYNDELYDAVIKNFIMKIRWQAQMLKRLHSSVIIVIDEPYLSAFGSGYISLSRNQVVKHVGTMIETIKDEGCVAGVHCCGNTDWSILIDTGTQLLNFDGDTYFQGITLYPEKLGEFLGNDGILAWGIIPTTERITHITLETILKEFDEKIGSLENRGFSRKDLLSSSIITPSCGMGTLSEPDAEKAMVLAAQTAEALKETYF